MVRIAASSDQSPPPAGPYSPSARIGQIVAAAGQGGFTAAGELLEGVGAQTRQALENIVANLAANGAGERDIISVRVFLTDPSQFKEMNEAYEGIFSEPYPARTTVYVGLPAGMLVEIDALAVVGQGDGS
ncbi:RidA family protein [Catenulispora subtropica]|uniref:RidA family protein n=1 Tax=Catenulispora subtropica TaxID=450798 RepID=A0ABN2T1H3_9ACTN